MSSFQSEDKSYKSQTVQENHTENNNKRNNSLTEYFDKLLKSKSFHFIIVVLLGSGVLCIIGIFAFIIKNLFTFGNLSTALELLYKIGIPIIAFFLFIIKFGDRSYK